MADVLTTLTSLAVSFFRGRSDRHELSSPWFNGLLSSDAVLQEAQRESFIIPTQQPAINDFVRLAFSEPDLTVLASREGELDPMLLHPTGGFRTSGTGLVAGMLSSSILQIYYLRLPNEEGTFVRIVLEGFEELRRAARGERIRAHAISGIARISMAEGTRISTPWGIVLPAPPVHAEQVFPRFGQDMTTCILAEPCLITVKFDREPSPQLVEASNVTPKASRILLPLSCALASEDSSKPIVPLITWSTLLLPFQVGFSYSMPLLPPMFGSGVDVSGLVGAIEEWARIIDRAHAKAVDIAATRLVSAVANRMDRSDSLVDAVMAWENLVGTSSEVTFRVTAALAKLLESDLQKRRALRKELAEIYNIRSRVVHGAPVDASDIDRACSRAIEVAVLALRASYTRGREWLALSSNERADTVLLEWH